MEINRVKFVNLNPLDQAKILLEIIKIFKCDRQTADFKMLSGTGARGIISRLNDITNNDSVYLINQSPTGLYENKVDLLK